MHNQRRIHYAGYETFDKIISNIQLALERDVKVTVRMNTDSNNVDKFLELKSYFENQGFMNYPKFSIYSALLKDNDSITLSEHQNLNFLSVGTLSINKKNGSGLSKDKIMDFINLYIKHCRRKDLFNSSRLVVQLKQEDMY